MRFLLISLACFLRTAFIGAQSIDIEVPELFSVCSSNTFEVQISNNTNDQLTDLRLTIQFNCGIEYISNSVSGATEADISNPSDVSFTISDLSANSQLTITLGLLSDCNSLDCVSGGQTAEIQTMLFSSGTLISSADKFFNLETPYLLITSIDKPVIFAGAGSTHEREITIRNTRPGSIASFDFTDIHKAETSISIDFGETIENTATRTTNRFNANEFQTIGNGDDLFDFNETLVIIEEIRLEDCEFDEETFPSELITSWSCDANCQAIEVKQIAVVNLDDGLEEAAKLVFEPKSDIPECLCNTDPHQQGLIIENTSLVTDAIDVFIDITQFSLGVSFFNHEVNIISDTGNSTVPITVSSPETTSCIPGQNTYRGASFTIPRVAAGERIEVLWDVLFCSEDQKNSRIGSFRFDYNYQQECVAINNQLQSGFSSFTLLADYNLDLDIGGSPFFEDETEGDIPIIVESDLFQQDEGILTIELFISCLLEIQDTDWALNGKLPVSQDIISINNLTTIRLEYALPFDEEVLTLNIPVKFTCLDNCGSAISQQFNLSSCSNPNCPQVEVFTIDANASISLSEFCDASCDILRCERKFYKFECDLAQDTVIIPAFQEFTFDARRINIGFPDNDNDQCADPSGDIILDSIDLQKAIVNDTILMEFESKLVFDEPSYLASELYFLLDMSYKAGAGVSDVSMLPEFNKFVNPQTGLVPLDISLTYFDIETGLQFDCSEVPLEYSLGAHRPLLHLNHSDQNVCELPQDIKFTAGDSISLQMTFRLAYNFESAANTFGTFEWIIEPAALISHEGVDEIETMYNCNCSTEILNIANVKYNIGASNATLIDICEGYADDKGFEKSLIVGVAPNFFPYEHRPTIRVNEIKIAAFESLVLDNIIFEESVFDCIDMPNTVVDFVDIRDEFVETDNGEDIIGYYIFHISNLVQSPWVESGRAKFNVIYRNNECILREVTNDDQVMQLNFSLYHLGEQAFIHNNRNFFYQKFPDINVNYDNFCELTSLDNQYTQIIEIYNDTLSRSVPAPFMWMKVISPNNLVQDFSIEDFETGAVFNEVSGIHQLPELLTGDSLRLIVRGTIHSCQTEDIIYTYGWHCEPHTDPGMIPCYADTVTCSVLAPEGKIDMLTTVSEYAASLCEPYDYMEVEIFNAGLGSIFDIYADIQMPTGFQILAGSAEISYPTIDNNFLPMSDPEIISAGIARFSFDSQIFPNGLLGVNSAPENSFKLRFKGTTDCSFVSGSSLLYNVSAYSVCGTPINKVAKVGEKLLINSISDTPETSLLAEILEHDACEDMATISISAEADLSQTSTLHVDLPEGLIYINGSCDGNLDNCEPLIQDGTMAWEIDTSQHQVNLSFSLSGFEALPCGTINLPVFHTILANANCIEIDSVCTIETITASDILSIDNDKPSLFFKEIETAQSELNPNITDLNILIENTGGVRATGFILDIYHDLDQSGDLSTADTLIGSEDINKIIQAQDDRLITLEGIHIPYEILCDVILHIDESKNCTCREDTRSLGPIDIDIFQEIYACHGEEISIGVTEKEGFGYVWDDNDHISCLSCPEVSFVVENETILTKEIIFTLSESSDVSCKFDHIFKVIVYPMPQILQTVDQICLGDQAELVASNGEQFEWIGPDIEDNQAQSIIVSPSSSATYYVHITDFNGCTGMDSIYLEVLAVPEAIAEKNLTFCYGEQAQLAAQEDPTYTYTWEPGFLLDDPNSPNPIIIDPVNSTYTLIVDNGVCFDITEVEVRFIDGLDVDAPTSIEACELEEIAIDLDPSNMYQWSPIFSDMCLNENCSSVSLSLEDSESFSVIAENSLGCLDTFSIDVEIEGLIISNTFNESICLGEQHLFNGVFYSEAGMYCDTLIDPSGCPIINCLDLKVLADLYDEDQIGLCIGDSFEYQGVVYDSPGTYCFDLVSDIGCDSSYCLQIEHFENPAITFLPFDTQVDIGSIFEINEINDHFTYEWSSDVDLSCTDCPNPSFLMEENTNLTLTVTDENGCQHSEIIELLARETCRLDNLLIPDAFTPDGNGKNDRFRIVNFREEAAEITIEIFNRWGEKVYFENGNTGWDGQYSGEDSIEGVYLYIIKVLCPNGRTDTFHGDVSLLR